MNVQRSINQLLAVGAGIKLMADKKATEQANAKANAKVKAASDKEKIAKSKLETLKARTEYKAIKKDPQAYLQQAQDQINQKYKQAEDYKMRQAIVKAGIPEGTNAFEQAWSQLKGGK